MNIKLLEYYIAKNNDSKATLAKALDMSTQTLYRRLQTQAFSFPEVKAIAKRYSLTNDEFCEIFLA